MAKNKYKQQMTEPELLTWLDNNIEHWRAVERSDNEENTDMARCYIDAFQTTRLAVFGHMKK